jgi:hypothetical protein
MELDSSLRWNDDASEAWTPNPINRFRTASILCYNMQMLMAVLNGSGYKPNPTTGCNPMLQYADANSSC